MVVLTIITPSNPHTVYFDQPLTKPSYIRLVSCSLYNSWHNLKEEAVISRTDESTPTVILLPGHYTIESLAEGFEDINKANRFLDLSTFTYKAVGSMVIHNKSHTKFSNNLAELLDINPKLPLVTRVKRLTSPSTYFIHCDLVDKEQNLFNGKPSTVLARFDLRGKPYEKVFYESTQQNILRDVSSADYVNSITLSVRDANGGLFDFNNNMSLEFELEIN